MSVPILITGGSGKLGRTLVRYFLHRGGNVVTTTRSEASRSGLLAAHPEHSADGRLQALALDLTSPSADEALLAFLDDRKCRPRALVNNARSQAFLATGPNGEVARDDFVGEFLVDVIAPYELTMALAGQTNSRLETVVNIGSIYGVVAANPALYDDPGQQSPLQYSVAKAAQLQLTRELAIRLAPIRVNGICFGGVEGRVDREFKERYGKLCPAGRMLRDDEVIGPVDYLVSEASSGMTGHNMMVDGGWTAW